MADSLPRQRKRRLKTVIIPVRCFTCGGLVGDKWEEFRRRVDGGEDAGKVLDSLGVRRYCCRRMLLSHLDVLDEVLEFSKKFAMKSS